MSDFPYNSHLMESHRWWETDTCLTSYCNLVDTQPFPYQILFEMAFSSAHVLPAFPGI